MPYRDNISILSDLMIPQIGTKIFPQELILEFQAIICLRQNHIKGHYKRRKCMKWTNLKKKKKSEMWSWFSHKRIDCENKIESQLKRMSYI